MKLRNPFVQLLFVSAVFLFSAYSQAEIYQWKDDAGRVHYSDKQSVATANVHKVSSTPSIPASVKLDVPLVKQGKNLCGPATIEMLFRCWGVNEYDQYDIAYNLLRQFSESGRVKRSGILQTNPIDWRLYPGTGTINMREFLERLAKTENPKLKQIPGDHYLAERERESRFLQLKEYLARGIPVIVHQYWGEVGSEGHYRLVTGYNEEKREVSLNDSTHGSVVMQSYERFLDLWNVKEPWLHYNAIVFNVGAQYLDPNVRNYKR
ncbi:C39 family peptidase [Neptunomonas phycophila]|uniref:C39 family peptidase n=1 Tax=Neptunomonas phycophila TaxID=1572645 RepID=UPI000948FADE|nr:C39 family peptidase [Neptunomonas phycophila]